MTQPLGEMKIRVPAEMKEWLQARAQENSRTLNGEVLHLLKKERSQEEQGKAPQHA